VSDEPRNPVDQTSDESVSDSALTRKELLKKGAAAGAAIAIVSPGAAQAAIRSAKQARGGILQVAISSARPADNYDPIRQPNQFSGVLGTALYNTLVRYDDQTWEVFPALASGIRNSADYKTWTFTIRRDVEWHDGKPLTAEDAAWTLHRILTPSLTPNLLARLSSVLEPKGIRVLNRRTLRLVLTNPDPFLPLILGQRDAELVQNGQGRQFGQVNGVGTGPFKLKSFQPGVSAEVERFTNYWEEGMPVLDGVRMVVIAEQATKLQSVVSGDSHFSDPIPPALLPVARSSRGINVQLARSARMMDIAMQQDQQPFTDNRVRTAFKLAVDRKRLITLAARGYGAWTSDIPVQRTDPFFPPGLLNRERDLALARRLLAEAGYPDGLDVTLNTTDLNGEKDFALAVAEMVREAGIRIRIREWDPATYLAQVWLRTPMYTQGAWSRRHPNEILSLTLLAPPTQGSFNEPHFTDPRLATLLANGRAAKTEADRRRFFRQALSIVANNSGWLIPYFYHVPFVSKSTVKRVGLDTVSIINFKQATIS
jgi:peptide/nickel transport system substrate-binding protein